MTILKNRFNKIIGKIIDQGSRINIYDENNVLLGYYSKSHNRTYDSNNNYIGLGNILSTLLAHKYL